MRSLVAAVSAGLIVSFVVPEAGAGTLPTSYGFELQARGNLAVNPGGSFNVPHGSTFGSTTVSMNNLGEVASKISTVGTILDFGIFYGPGDGTGGVVAQANSDDVFWSDVNIGDTGRIVVPQNLSGADGVYFRDRAQPAGVSLLTSAIGGSLSGLRVLPDNRIAARSSLSGVTGYRSYNPAGGAVQTYITQSVGGFSFLATAGASDNGTIAGRVFNDTQPSTGNDQIRRFNPDGTSTLIATEGGTVPGATGTISSFANSLSANALGEVAFLATVGGKLSVVASDGTNTRLIANADSPLVSGVDFFAPAINSLGFVAFRGKDEAGNDAIFIGDGTGLTRVIGELDVVGTDLGLGQLGQNNVNDPTFAGGIALNDSNQIAFTAGLYPQGDNQIEWGTGIFVATVPEPSGMILLLFGVAVARVCRSRR